ncbi:GDYXXLXY domain-containing protein [Leptolyngbya sp. FACHB-36]|uniref:GDYXXLXY domain-containing protein n=1 Tax=Leptolyngbya sp. FACHB-36 TaxID=2692808 RepID=UPI0016806F34|nr:GDYXXLXY domain-containing protein [Leptolyngbya sp. FACHB-36]MBD2021819.1 GDYXXLXY domain-containing protein [Leptolyngbya sp. FACHB-36]
MTDPLPVSMPETLNLPVTSAPKRLPGWRLWLPLVFQAALIVTIPAQDAYTYVTGKTVVLQTIPVDPYDIMRGYSQTLRYTISQVDFLKKLPGGDRLTQSPLTDLYVVLQAPDKATNPPTSWKPVRVSVDRPTNLSANQIAIKGRYSSGQVLYGLESYYMPEDQRTQLNTTIQQTRQTPQAFVVETKIDATGNAVPVSLWVRDRNYRF